MTLHTPTSRFALMPRLIAVCALLCASALAMAQTAPAEPAAPAAAAAPESAANGTGPVTMVSELSKIPVPTLGAKAWLTLDANSGQIIAAQDPDARVEPASLTKLMSAYVVFEALEAGRLTLDQKAHISEKAWRTEGSRMFIEPNTDVTIDELLQGLIVQSGNDATVALAEAVAGSDSAFVALMNQEAVRQGLSGTHYTNSPGLPDPEHYTTVRDLAVLSRNLERDFPKYMHYYSQKEFTYNKIKQSNRNRLLWADSTVDGLKTGHTKSAGYCLVSTALRDGRRVISVLVGAASDAARAENSLKLLNWSFQNFDTVRLVKPDDAAVHARVWEGEQDTVGLSPGEPLWVTVPRGRDADIKSLAHYAEPLLAPLEKGASVGTLEVSMDGRQIVTVPLLAQQSVPQAGFFSRMIDKVRLLFN